MTRRRKQLPVEGSNFLFSSLCGDIVQVSSPVAPFVEKLQRSHDVTGSHDAPGEGWLNPRRSGSDRKWKSAFQSKSAKSSSSRFVFIYRRRRKFVLSGCNHVSEPEGAWTFIDTVVRYRRHTCPGSDSLQTCPSAPRTHLSWCSDPNRVTTADAAFKDTIWKLKLMMGCHSWTPNLGLGSGSWALPDLDQEVQLLPVCHHVSETFTTNKTFWIKAVCFNLCCYFLDF